LAKAYLDVAGFKAPLIPDNRLGPWFAAFHGGWTEASVRGNVPVILLDYKKMYQTQFCLQGIQELLSSKRLIFEDDTANVIKFVQHVTRDDCFDSTKWRELNVLCWVTPEGETLITKARFNGGEFSTGMVPRPRR
jgi:hypothetical protein